MSNGLIGGGRPASKISFEFFPPKTEEMEKNCGRRSSGWRP